jgi:hypothetical protein
MNQGPDFQDEFVVQDLHHNKGFLLQSVHPVKRLPEIIFIAQHGSE